MRRQAILITGASGEVGQALVRRLSVDPTVNLLSMDLHPLPDELNGMSTHITGDILDRTLLDRVVSQYEIDSIYHLAALLSTRSEFTPEMAHRVNVEGTLTLLNLAAEQSQWRSRPIQFIFPSSIAIYGLPDPETKVHYNRVREWEWNQPRTMYGCNKVYGEMLGTYFGRHYRQLAAERPTHIDFRSVRFPGLISAFTLPSGGTSDYGPEMIHAAARGEPYRCFVRADTRIPFMTMPDAVESLLNLAAAPRETLTRQVYNVTSFSLSAGEIRERVLEHFPTASIEFESDPARQTIVDSWPADLDDSAARRDWGWRPRFGVDAAFREYLIPTIRNRYAETEG